MYQVGSIIIGAAGGPDSIRKLGFGCWVPQTSQQVRASYNRLRPLEKLQVEKRGWTLDVLQVVQSLGKLEFTLADVYAHADALAKLHPNNAHVRDKMTIRRG